MSLSPRRIALATLVELTAVIGLYLALAAAFAGGQTVATLLAQGSGAPPAELVLAVSFVALRFVVVVLVPAFAVYRLVRFGFALARARMAPREVSEHADQRR